MTKKTAPILLIVLLICGLAVAGYFYTTKTDAETESAELQEVSTLDEAATENATIPTSIDVKTALSERILGNPNAPIKISEHSSFSCGHCGAFHKNVFKDFKARFIDTGEAYLVFSDFPLNAPALHASMATRCAPEDQYFAFVDHLFETQDDWAFDPNYMNLLQKKAENHGLDAKSFKACIDNEEIQEGIVNRMRAAQAQWQVNSTPSFVINNTVALSGGKSIEDFENAIASLQNPAAGTETPENAETNTETE